jgi:phosphoglycolate phosphatase-like HAD superfamily hydrolase
LLQAALTALSGDSVTNAMKHLDRSALDAIDTLIFDMDGTLIDSMSTHADTFSAILREEFNIPVAFSKELYFRTAGRPLDEQFVCAIRGATNIKEPETPELLDRFWTLIDQSEPIPFTDVPDALHQFCGLGYTLIVISNCAPFLVKSKMKRVGLDDYFSLQLGTDKRVRDMVKGSGHFEIIQKTLRVTPQQFRNRALLVGDSSHDVILGKQAGLMTIGRASGAQASSLIKAGADLVIDNLTALVSVLTDAYAPL